ncbi:MAG: MFS transporter [Pseudomonadota bacterium]
MASILGSTVPVDINSRKTIFAIIFLAVIGPCVFIVQPGFVGDGLIGLLSFSESQAGDIAAAEMWGIALTTVLLIPLAGRVSWRVFTAISVLFCTAGNLASIGQTDFDTLRVLRFLTGLGSGGIISLTFTMMGLTARADRNFGFIIVWVLTYGGLGLLVMPWAFGTLGMNGVLMFFGLFCLSGLLFVRALPDSSQTNEETSKGNDDHYSGLLKSVSLLAILVYNIGIGIVWVFLFAVGVEDASMEPQAVAQALFVSQLMGIVGAFGAVFLEAKIGRFIPLMIGMFGGAAGIYLLLDGVSVSEFWYGVCIFNLLWNLSMPYLLGTMAEFESSGRMVVYGVAMQMVGLAVGPFIAARIVDKGGFDGVNMTAIGFFVVSALLIIPAALAQKKVAGLR